MGVTVEVVMLAHVVSDIAPFTCCAIMTMACVGEFSLFPIIVDSSV